MIYAEVVHLPEGRTGNVLSRPVLRTFEIPFSGMSGAPFDRQILLDDLLVRVVGQQVVLRSRRLNRIVRPRMSTAHNHVRSALAPYRFLVSLAYTDVMATARWSWGPLEAAPFLPRVTAGRIV